MLGKLFSTLGGTIGGQLGGGIFSTIGRFAGSMLGNYLEHLDYEPEEYHQFKNIKDSFALTSANVGFPIPLIFGTARVSGKIIWSSQITEVQKDSLEEKYFANSNQVKLNKHIVECEYYISVAIAICEGEILEIKRVWAGSDLINLGDFKFRIYHGSENQEPDPLIAGLSENGQAPAFRDLAYIVFEDLPLDEFGSTIPNFSFEITRKANVPFIHSVEDQVKSIVMIPGSGEFVYDTEVQYKVIKNLLGGVLTREAINSHNPYNKANSVHSLDQLQLTCPNIEWIAVVACWFGDSTDAGFCTIKPCIEYNDPSAETTEAWQVGKYTRLNACEVSKDPEGSPRYGGSVNDASLLRYLTELRNRGIKIMFYPMIFLDVERKPWRGHLTGNEHTVREFFTKSEGYNDFILHYANTIKDYVDAFVIGSELIGLTKVKGSNGQYPAVQELIKLAREVKNILGNNVFITYAADWSEYHHTEGGWYNLDDLWASSDIDFIGIDAYFPVTSSLSSSILPEEIIKGWESGEGYDYYLDQNKVKQPLAPAYAWKNLQYWWENYHQNPDGQRTNWQPRMKKIWFTEFGFPSIDKATNQPNVFFDPNCLDGGLPKYSTGEIDFSIQRIAIKAFIEYWENKEFIGRSFLWTWDARPYPAWPHMDIWKDGYLWEKGHWVNNKFGASSVVSIIMELSNKCGLNLDNIDVSTVDESIEGVIFSKHYSAFDIINILRISHFFDLTATFKEEIRFIKRGSSKASLLNNKNLIKLTSNSFISEISLSANEIISKIRIYFIDQSKEYNTNYRLINSELNAVRPENEVNLPIVMSPLEAARLGELILKNAFIEDKVITFILPSNSLQYEPGDFVELLYLNKKYSLRIIYLKKSDFKLEITGIIDDAKSYYLPAIKQKELLIFTEAREEKFIILDLPPIFSLSTYQPLLIGYYTAQTNKPLLVSITDNNSYKKITTLTSKGIIGNVVEFQNEQTANIFTIDEISKIIITSNEIDLTKLGACNRALIGEEIISFSKIHKIGSRQYELTSLIRGLYSTENKMFSHNIGEIFILLDISPNIIYISEQLIGQPINFRVGENIQSNFIFQNNQFKPYPPFIILSEIINHQLHLAWRERSNFIDNWITLPAKVESLTYFINLSAGDLKYDFTTEGEEFFYDLSTLRLSGEVNITIISIDREGRKSRAQTLILTI